VAASTCPLAVTCKWRKILTVAAAKYRLGWDIRHLVDPSPLPLARIRIGPSIEAVQSTSYSVQTYREGRRTPHAVTYRFSGKRKMIVWRAAPAGFFSVLECKKRGSCLALKGRKVVARC